MKRFVIIINTDLAIGLAANTAAVLAMSVGARHQELIGADIEDADGQTHFGITNIPIAVLAADDATFSQLLTKLKGTSIELVSFSKVAQSIHSYEEYTERLAQTPSAEIAYSGVALFGDSAEVTSLVGSLPRLK